MTPYTVVPVYVVSKVKGKAKKEKKEKGKGGGKKRVDGLVCSANSSPQFADFLSKKGEERSAAMSPISCLLRQNEEEERGRGGGERGERGGREGEGIG